MSEKNNDKINEEILKEILTHMKKQPQLSEEDIKKHMNEIQKENIDFLGKIDNIEEYNGEKRIVFTDGNEQLLYEKGEFFIISTIDSKKEKNKITKIKAKEMFLEYFITYILNPTINKENGEIKTIEIKKIEKVETKTPKSKEKKIETNKPNVLIEELKTKTEKTPNINVKEEIVKESIEDVENKVKNIISKKPKNQKEAKKIEIREEDKIL